MITIYGIRGRNGEDRTISTELPIQDLLLIAARSNFDAVGGLDLEKQHGINRPLDAKHSANICQVFEDQLTRNYPIENGCVVLAKSERAVIKVTDRKTGFAEITINDGDSLSLLDRMHTTDAFRMADRNPEAYPNLYRYIRNPENTISARIIDCNSQGARRRCLALNTGSKKWTPVEMLMSMTLDCKANERDGVKSYERERPALVMYEFCHKAAKDSSHPLYDLLPVDPGVKYDPSKNRTNLAHFIDSMWSLFPLLEQFDDFVGLSLEDQANYVKTITLPYWRKLKSSLPNAFATDTWYNYNTLRKGAPILAECYNSLVRVWVEFHNKKSKIALLSIKGMSFQQFVQEHLAKFIDQTDPSYPWKNEQFWAVKNGAFGVKHKDEGEDAVCQYVWQSLGFKGISNENWDSFRRTIQGHANKLRYNERKSAMSSTEIKIRRNKRKMAK